MPNYINLLLIALLLCAAYHLARETYLDVRLRKLVGNRLDWDDIRASLIVIAFELLIAYQLLTLYLISRAA